MKIRDFLFLYLFVFISATSELTFQNNDNYHDYCVKSGGVILNNTMGFGTRGGYVDGFSYDFCEIVKDGNLGMIGLETIGSTLPSLAATYIKNINIDRTKPILGPYYQPAVNLCYSLGGSCLNYYHDGGFYDERGFSGICYFGDGSNIATWTLYYIGIGMRDDIKL